MGATKQLLKRERSVGRVTRRRESKGNVVKKNAVVISLLVGVVVGVLGALILPSIARPYLPRSLRGEDLPGVVRAKQRDGDRLLLTVVTQTGTVLATYTEEVAGIDMLVQVGDSVALEVGEYEPFLMNPEIGRVLKGPEMPAGTPMPVAPPLEPNVPTMRDSTALTRDTIGPPRSTARDTSLDVRDTVSVDTTGVSRQ